MSVRVSVKSVVKKTPWYVAGLHFECMRCGGCCAGPTEGYIWVTRLEIELIADFLKITTAELRRKFLRRVGLRTTIIEHPISRDCIFLNTTLSLRGAKRLRGTKCRSKPGVFRLLRCARNRLRNLIRSQAGDCHGPSTSSGPRNDIQTSNTAYRKCMIYPVRPSQCRMWPFWPSNLANPAAWNETAQKCPGINHGRLYSCEEIEKIKKKKTPRRHKVKKKSELKCLK